MIPSEKHQASPAFPPSQRSRVVVTGIGLVTSLGLDRETTWENLCLGKSGAQWLDLPTAPGQPRWAGFPLPESSQHRDDPVIEAAREAVLDAKLFDGATAMFDPERAAVVVGSSKGDLGRLADFRKGMVSGANQADERGSHWLRDWPHGMAEQIGRKFDFLGPRIVPVAACATGVVAVLRAADLIRRRECDLALAGAGDAQFALIALAAFRRMGVLARVTGEPSQAVRPGDRHRDGFLPGLGSAILILESEEHAQRRGVHPLAEIAGGALGADAHHLTSLNPDPSPRASLISRALERSGTSPDEVDYVNLHATATRGNDPLECQAVRLALGEAADRVSCSANKAQIGHLLGAAGAAELAITCLAIRDGFIPPTINLADPDPVCDLDLTPQVGRARPITAALKLSVGFGGHLAVAVLRSISNASRNADIAGLEPCRGRSSDLD